MSNINTIKTTEDESLAREVREELAARAREDAQEQESERRGWDAGEDDLADYNANEADDYRDE